MATSRRVVAENTAADRRPPVEEGHLPKCTTYLESRNRQREGRHKTPPMQQASSRLQRTEPSMGSEKRAPPNLPTEGTGIRTNRQVADKGAEV
jgi:hypothetical protein